MHHRIISLTEFFLLSVWLRCSFTLQAPPPRCAHNDANTHPQFHTHHHSTTQSKVCVHVHGERILSTLAATAIPFGRCIKIPKPFDEGWWTSRKEYCMRYPQSHWQTMCVDDDDADDEAEWILWLHGDFYSDSLCMGVWRLCVLNVYYGVFFCDGRIANNCITTPTTPSHTHTYIRRPRRRMLSLCILNATGACKL